jgi:hypothetical protein
MTLGVSVAIRERERERERETEVGKAGAEDEGCWDFHANQT